MAEEREMEMNISQNIFSENGERRKGRGGGKEIHCKN